MNDGVFPNVVHGRHAIDERNPHEIVKVFVDKAISDRIALDSNGLVYAHSYGLGAVESRLGSVMSRLKHFHPHVYEEMLVIFEWER